MARPARRGCQFGGDVTTHQPEFLKPVASPLIEMWMPFFNR
jgi:hypothetical protein